MTDSRNVLIIATAYGVEADELTQPRAQLQLAGHTVTVATPEGTTIDTLRNDRDPGPAVHADAPLAEIDEGAFDLLVVPGGTLNADALRLDDDAVRLVHAFAQTGKPIGAICHGPWVAVEAGILVGKTLTSFPSLRTDLTNAGATWVDAPVVVDGVNGFTLVTSRTPDDLGQFAAALTAQLA